MKTIGMFFSNKEDMISAYRKHSQSVNNLARSYGTTTVNPSQVTITVDDYKWRYYAFEDDKCVHKIAGIQFDAVFSEVTDPYAKMFIMSRFRPRFDK